MLSEKQEVLFETDGGSPASTWLSGSQHPSTAAQQVAHEELVEVPETSASDSISQVTQGGGSVSGHMGGTTIFTGGALPQGHTAYFTWLQLAQVVENTGTVHSTRAPMS